jgi:predicted secreted hydrolase
MIKLKPIIHIRILMILAGLLALISGCTSPPEEMRVDIAGALSGEGDAGCYEMADQPADLIFPRDRGPHNSFKTEWWYYTGNLTTDTGRHFGFQLTFFRQALGCEKQSEQEGKRSAWRTQQLYFSHFAITDTLNQTFYSAQRMSRGAMGLAGAQSRPYKVWIDQWRAEEAEENTIHLSAKDRVPANNSQKAEAIALDLNLFRAKPTILQGRKGWSQKGPKPAHASYYYSFPGLAVQGHLFLGRDSHRVSGTAWFDHEWSTSALDSTAGGWDWFSFRLESGPYKGADIMVCQVRDRNGRANGFSYGSISFMDGGYKILTKDEFIITPRDNWKSPRTQKKYPSKWIIELVDQGISLEVATLVPDQEHPHGFAYYEGAVKVRGKGISGLGYVEMTGY